MVKSWKSLSLCLALTGCQSISLTPSPVFLLGSTASAPVVAAAVAPAAPLGNAVPAAVATGMGQVTVSVASVFQPAQRRLLSLLADVDHLTVTLKDSAGTSHTQTLAKTVSSCTFSGIPAGQATVSIVVFDVNNKTIGSDAEYVNVVAGQTTTFSPKVTLNFNALPPATDAGGGQTPTTGAVAVGLTLATGLNAQTLRLVSTPVQISAMSPGDVSVVNGNLLAIPEVAPNPGALVSVSPSGQETVLCSQSTLSNGSTTLASDIIASNSHGPLWAGGTRIDATGAVQARFASSANCWNAVTDSVGDLWAIVTPASQVPPTGAVAQVLYKISPTGTLLLQVPIPGGVGWGLRLDSQDRVYLGTATNVLLLASDGTTVRTFTPAGYGIAWGGGAGGLNSRDDIAVDSKGDLWAIDGLGTTLIKLGPDGTQLGAFNLPGSADSVSVDAQDDVWVNDYGTKGLEKLDNSGNHLALFCLPDTTMAFDPVLLDGTGAVWAQSASGWGRYTP